ncbi:MAG: preQ(1) synthase [Bdellovibrio sp.]
MKKKNSKKSLPRDPKSLSHMKLGQKKTEYKTTYDPKILESFDNKNPKAQAWTTFICTEFTSLCPKTGQPDFARITINYIADKKMVESKSMKLYLFSFRNHGDFHEDCVQTICDDLVALLKPKYLEVLGEFTPRGGIAIYPYSNYANNQDEFQMLKKSRIMNYAPGRYSMPLERIY